jgi:hypothetical protein
MHTSQTTSTASSCPVAGDPRPDTACGSFDHRDEAAPPADELASLLASAVEADRRDPYRQVAVLLHIIYI